MKCAACAFFKQLTRHDPDVRAEVNLPAGDCRRNAPRSRLAPDGKRTLPGFWPRVGPEDFCGEFRERTAS